MRIEIELKYKVGKCAYLFECGRVCRYKLTDVRARYDGQVSTVEYYCESTRGGGGWVNQEDIYAKKEDTINRQIEYHETIMKKSISAAKFHEESYKDHAKEAAKLIALRGIENEQD